MQVSFYFCCSAQHSEKPGRDSVPSGLTSLSSAPTLQPTAYTEPEGSGCKLHFPPVQLFVCHESELSWFRPVSWQSQVHLKLIDQVPAVVVNQRKTNVATPYSNFPHSDLEMMSTDFNGPTYSTSPQVQHQVPSEYFHSAVHLNKNPINTSWDTFACKSLRLKAVNSVKEGRSAACTSKILLGLKVYFKNTHDALYTINLLP